jgi:hypothetical protein
VTFTVTSAVPSLAVQRVGGAEGSLLGTEKCIPGDVFDNDEWISSFLHVWLTATSCSFYLPATQQGFVTVSHVPVSTLQYLSSHGFVALGQLLTILQNEN